MIDRKSFGITACPLGLWFQSSTEANTFVICKQDTETLEYYNKEKHKWVKNIFEATLWPKDKEGETPYLANNVYSLTSGFTAKGYTIADRGAFNLNPCYIKYDKLYLKQYYNIYQPGYISKNKLATDWTNDFYQAHRIDGPEKALDIIWELITNG